jgi:pyroglutamyl-peptidase
VKYKTEKTVMDGGQMAKVVITGFEPYDGSSLNPSEELVKLLDGRNIGRYLIVGKALPLDYSRALDIVKHAITEHAPEFVLCCGQANRAAITLEFVGINVRSTEREDNYGNKPETQIINPNAPAAYFSTIDVHRIAKVLQEKGIPSGVSYHAGTYGCNWLLFSVLDWLSKISLDCKVAFVHVPPLPKQAIEKNDLTLATMPLDTTSKAMKIIVESLE